MSESILRREFERARVMGTPVERCLNNYGVPEEKKTIWESRIEKRLASETAVPALTGQGRRLNNFCIGSDPEFVFATRPGARKANAADLGLKPGLACGSDQNMRLAELRGWPSTSVVEHLAGVLSSLRWMYRLYPNVREYQWKAGAWYDGDGIGGHVHFGRKRSTRDAEIRGLDGLTKVIKTLGMFNNVDWATRTAGDGRGQRYGDYGDFRPQLHGYEYRTLPSWLCSPEKAFMCIAASKLVIFDPEITTAWMDQALTPPEALGCLKRLAQYYAGRDDDAWILRYMLGDAERYSGAFRLVTDFKATWGFNPKRDTPTAAPTGILPAVIAPTPEDTQEMLLLLTEQRPLTYVEREPTFVNRLPTGYSWMFEANPRNVGRQGVGDLMSNLVSHRSHPIKLVFNDAARVTADLCRNWTPEEWVEAKKLVPELTVDISGDYTHTVMISRAMTPVDRIRQTRTFLLKTGLFPIWTVEGVKDSSAGDWVASRVKTSKRKPKERTL